MSKSGRKIEKLIDMGNWPMAERALGDQLKVEPDHHWLVTMLAIVQCEQGRYRLSLRTAKRALHLAHSCPLVLWNYACSLDKNTEHDEAIAVWKGLLRRGARRLAAHECGEGLAWARALVNDARYRVGRALWRTGDAREARRYLKLHVRERRRSGQSLYRLREVRRALADAEADIA